MLRGCPPDGYVACCAAVRDMDQRADLVGIRVPTSSSAAPTTSRRRWTTRLIASTVPGARLVELDAAHLSNIERAAEFNPHLLDFLA